MKAIACIILGYLLGSISPSALISKVKKKDLRENGTGNLGATNVLINFGKLFAVLVMLFDIMKAFFIVKFTAYLFPLSSVIPLAAGAAAVVGHIFPFYMKFKGGKGLAAYGGMVLAYDPSSFLFLLILGVSLMLILNYAVIIPTSASVLFPIFTLIKTGDYRIFIVTVIVSAVLVFAHINNILEVIHGCSPKIREYIRNNLIAHNK